MIQNRNLHQATPPRQRKSNNKYMPIRFTSRLLDHLRHDGYRPSTIRVIVKDLRIMVEDRDAFDQAIQEAQSEGVIEIDNDQCVRLPSLPDEMLQNNNIVNRWKRIICFSTENSIK